MALAALLVAALLAAGIIYQLIGTARDARRYPPPGRMVEIGSGRLHIHVAGPKPGAAYVPTGPAYVPPGATHIPAPGPTVVFDAGIAASSLSWLKVAPGVAEFARAVSYDRSGFAWSDRTHTPVSARSLAAELQALLQNANVLPPYVFVAHSYGTFVVRAFASDFPGKAAGLVLVDPIYPAEWLNMDRAMQRRVRGGIVLSYVGALLASVGFVRLVLNLLLQGSRTGPRSAARLFGREASALLTRLVLQVRKLPEEMWPVMRAHWSRPRSFLAMADHLASLRRSAQEIADARPAGDIPVVVLTAGAQSAPVREEQAKIAAESPRGAQIVVEGAGHWILIDQPDAVVDAVKRVLSEGRV
jgi:pimeloyl-ACP methyl ester carboxylesterase